MASHGLVRYAGDVLVYADGARIASLTPDDPRVPLPPGQTGLVIIVENQGRANFGPKLGERKGVTAVRLAERFITGWDCAVLEPDDPDFTAQLTFTADRPDTDGLVAATATLTIDAAPPTGSWRSPAGNQASRGSTDSCSAATGRTARSALCTRPRRVATRRQRDRPARTQLPRHHHRAPRRTRPQLIRRGPAPRLLHLDNQLLRLARGC